MTSIALAIADLVKNNEHITDIQVRENAAIFTKSPEGLKQEPGPALRRSDIEEFFDFVSPTWRQRIKNPRGDFNEAITVDNRVRLRVNGFIFGETQSLGSSIRCQPISVPDVDTLGVPELIKFFLECKGLVLVTGPTGAGKSTTIAAAIEYLNKSKGARTIVTIEDPIEYEIPSRNSLVTQRQVGSGYLESMADGVISALRQNAGVIVIGEVRTKDTIDAMMRAASSGHLVLASMHTNSARDTVETTLNVYSGEEVATKAAALSSMLVGVISQQLVPRKDRKGFALVTEALIVNQAVRQAIRDRKFSEFVNLMTSSGSSGNSYSLNRELRHFVQSDLISTEDALQASYDPQELKHMLGQQG